MDEILTETETKTEVQEEVKPKKIVDSTRIQERGKEFYNACDGC